MNEDFIQPELGYPLKRSLNWRSVSRRRLFLISGVLIQKMLLSSYSFSVFLPGMEMKYAGLTFFFFLIIARHSVFWCFLFHSSTINIVIDLYLHHHKVFRVTSILCKSMFCSQNQNKILATDRPSQFLMWRKVEENGKVKHLKNKCLI